MKTHEIKIGAQVISIHDQRFKHTETWIIASISPDHVRMKVSGNGGHFYLNRPIETMLSSYELVSNLHE